MILDPAGQGRRRRDHAVARLHLDAVRLHHHVPAALDDPPHRGAQHHPRSERLRDAAGHQLRAAYEAILLGRADEVLEAPRGVDVEEHVQQRHVARLAREHGLDSQVEQEPALVRLQVGELPGLERLPVPLARPRRLPGGGQRHLARHLVQRRQSHREVGDGGGLGRRDRARVGLERAEAVVHVQALVVGGERLHAHGGGQRGDPLVPGPDPLPANVHRHALHLLGPGTSAHAVAGLEHHHRVALLPQRPGGREAGEPRADHRHIGRAPVAPAAIPIRRRGGGHRGTRAGCHGAAEQCPAGRATTGHRATPRPPGGPPIPGRHAIGSAGSGRRSSRFRPSRARGRTRARRHPARAPSPGP